MNLKILFLFILNFFFKSCIALMPSFDRASENLTVIIGNSAVLPCFISNLGDHKVAWIKVANMDILTIGDYKVTNDDRIKLPQGYVSDWSLSIQPINEEDAGEYICQVNTEPQIISKIYLQVQLPPKIIEEKSTINPGPVKEGSNLKIYCHSEGIPSPKVSWYFRKPKSKNDKLFVQNHHKVDQIIHEGDTLIIRNITRHHSGVFECIANNSVPPAASRKIKVSVEFGPEILVTNEKVEQIIGQDARLECKIKSNPLISHYWMLNGQVIENENFLQENKAKYDIFTFNQNDFMTVSGLIVKNLTLTDFGKYECYAVNGYNTSKGEIILKELIYRRSTTTKATQSRILIYQERLKEQKSTTSKSTHPKLHRKNLNTSKLIKNYKVSEDEYIDESLKLDNLFSSGVYRAYPSINLIIILIFTNIF